MNRIKIQKLIDNGNLISYKSKYEALPEEEKNLVMERVEYYDSLYALRDAREKLGFSQEDLASRTGLSRATINRIESGSKNFTYDKFIRVAHALDLNVNVVSCQAK